VITDGPALAMAPRPLRVGAASDFARRHSVALSVAAGAVLTLLLRAPWLDAPLGRDEGGVALVARSFDHSGPFAYGHLFLDRPPLLVELYRAAGADPAGIRLLGALASVLLVVTTTLIAVRVAGRAAAPIAAAIAALFASSFALGSVFTPAELLAVVPSSASVLLLLTALERSHRRHLLLALAGALAVAALLVKQSFGDALAAGAVAIAAGAIARLPWRETAARAGAYLGGGLAMGGALAVWEHVVRTPDGSIFYALFGFRLDAASSLASGDVASRLDRLALPLLGSGLVVALALALPGIARVRGRPLARPVLAAWLLVALGGVALGGSYWPHYLIALVPAAAVGASALLVHRRTLSAVALCAIAIPVAAVAAHSALRDVPDGYEGTAVTVGHYLRDRAEPHQTAYVMYAKVNVLFYSGLRDPYPYNWSLMVRAAPRAQVRLRRLLASPRRPTWVVQWQSHSAFGLDANGATRTLIRKHYRRVTTICGHPVLLARGSRARPAPPRAAHACGRPEGNAV
jgi:hypothetical protein